MFKTVEDLQHLSRSQIEATTQAAAVWSRGMQQIALEASDLSKKSIEETSSAFGKMIGVRSLDGAMQVQSDYAKSTYDSMMHGASRFSELFTSLAKESYKPFEGASRKRFRNFGKTV